MYAQEGTDTFVPQLSAIDLLFDRGRASGEVVRRGSRIGESSAPVRQA